MKQYQPITLCLLLLIAGSGCTSPKTFRTVGVSDLPSPTNPSQVRVFARGGTVPEQQYQILGKVTAWRKEKRMSRGSAESRLKTAAAGMGADALADLHGGITPGLALEEYYSGIAARWSQATDQPRALTTPFVVALLPTANLPQGPGNEDKIREAIISTAVLRLEVRGYLILPRDQETRPMALNSLAGLSDAELSALGGREAQLLFGTEVLGRESANAVVASSDALEVRVFLFNKRTRDVVFSNVGLGAFATGWLLNLSAPNMKRIQVASIAVDNALATLPPVCEPLTQ